jgi:hypothetical protein
LRRQGRRVSSLLRGTTLSGKRGRRQGQLCRAR